MLSQPTPRHIYLDTSVIVGAIVTGAPHANACSVFCNWLAARDSRVYFSQVLRLELSQALRHLATRHQQLPQSVQQQYQLDQWGTSAPVRERWLALGITQFQALLGRFTEVIELPFRLSTWSQSVDIMAREGLQSLDAVHVATAQEHGLRDFATVDADFQRIPRLRVRLIR